MELREIIIRENLSGSIERAILKVVSEMGAKAPVGEVKAFAGAIAPTGWVNCEGQLLLIAEYPVLFSVIGISHGGDGIVDFKLPDLRGRTVVGVGNGATLTPRTIGETGGEESVVLTEGQIPAHAHQMNISNILGETPDPTGAILANAASFDNEFSIVNPVTGTMRADAITTTGGGAAHENMQPFTALNYIIYLGE